jgi:hypothetical protein
LESKTVVGFDTRNRPKASKFAEVSPEVIALHTAAPGVASMQTYRVEALETNAVSPTSSVGD